MASVPSLDKDLAKLRLSKYTPQAANEVKSWIESTLDESLGGDDLMDCLHDGTVLCRLVNKLIPGGAKFKQSAMPFVQMENIALFLRVCSETLKLPPHDLFLTVDLYEFKDPAQVLQTIGAFSRVANSRNSSAFPTAIGPKSSTSSMSPGKNKPPVPSRSTVSSWSKPNDELTSAPAWNIHQYGYMGGASQGREGVVMGGRRQITSAGPHVPSLKEKEERRKREAEEMGERRAADAAREAEDEREKQRQEEELWLQKEEDLRKQQQQEEERVERIRRQAEAREREQVVRERRELEVQERAIREAEERQRREDELNRSRLEEQHAQQDRREYQKFTKETFRPLSQEHEVSQPSYNSESDRIRELERQLEEAKAREKAYISQQQSSQRSTPRTITPPNEPEADSERDYLRNAWQENTSRPLPQPKSARPLPQPPSKPASKPRFTHSALAAQRQREMQDEDDAEESTAKEVRTPSPAPPPTPPRGVGNSPLAGTRWGFRGSRAGSVLQKPPAGASSPSGTMSIVQREMEMERQRQKEWEQNQQQLSEDRKVMTDKELQDGSEMPWDVNQYGYTGGANQGTEQVAFGARRQIIGPRGQR